MAPKRRIIFHIGLEKTGTSSFQQFCTDQQKLLRRHRVLYPTASWAFGQYNHAPLVACYMDYRDFSMESSGRRRRHVLSALMVEIEKSKLDAILISSEHFSSRFKEAEIELLFVDFAAFDCHVAVVVRDHLARLFSAYAQSVLSGRHMTLDQYCDELFHPENRYTRYASTIAAWERVFGRENIRIFCYSPDRDIVQELCAALVAPDFPAPKAYRDNISIGRDATERLRQFNAAIARIPGLAHPATRRFLRGPRRLLAQSFSRAASKEEAGRWQLSKSNLQRLSEIAEADVIWLRERYGIDLGTQEQPDDQSERTKSSTDAK